MTYFVADLKNRESLVYPYAEREDAESTAEMLNNMGMGDWLVLVSLSETPS
jgi:hypothetical protein